MPESSPALVQQGASIPATETPALLPAEARGLVFTAGGRPLINGLDLTIRAGPLTVVMGPNGAGKSLLLRLLHGLIAPAAGSVLWGGKPPTEPIRRRQALVFQRPVLLRRSVAANVRFVLRLRGSDSPERVRELLRHVGLAPLAAQPARRLSGGEQQRLALARALALEPEVMLLDEPTANLDPTATAAIESIVRNAQRQGTKILFVTHDLGQARRLADEVVFLHHGRVIEQTPAARFFDQPDTTEARDHLAGRLVL
jgi:tungstate transport system ATP-binding protein